MRKITLLMVLMWTVLLQAQNVNTYFQDEATQLTSSTLPSGWSIAGTPIYGSASANTNTSNSIAFITGSSVGSTRGVTLIFPASDTYSNASNIVTLEADWTVTNRVVGSKNSMGFMVDASSSSTTTPVHIFGLYSCGSGSYLYLTNYRTDSLPVTAAGSFNFASQSGTASVVDGTGYNLVNRVYTTDAKTTSFAFASAKTYHITAVLNFSTKKITSITISGNSNTATLTNNGLGFSFFDQTANNGNIAKISMFNTRSSKYGNGTTLTTNTTYQSMSNLKIYKTNNLGTLSNNSPQCSSTGVTLSTTASSATGETLYWQDTSTGTSTSNPTPGNTTSSGNKYLRMLTTNTNSAYNVWSDASSAVPVTVYPVSVAGTAAASNATASIQIITGNTTTVSLTGNTGSIQWQSSPDGATNWSDISGATSSSYTTPALSSGTYYYRAIITSGNCSSSTSNTVTVTAAESQSAPPTITASGNATVDGAFDISFTDDASWRGMITGITVDGSALDPSAYNTTVANKITFTPSASVLLQGSGSKTIVISATGYNIATFSQTISAGNATQLIIKTQPVTPASNGAIFATQPEVYIKDQYNNLTTGTVVATVTTPQTWLLGGTSSKVASSGTATFTDLTADTTGKIAYSAATLTFTLGALTTTSNAFDIIAYQTSSNDQFKTTQAGSWSSNSTWLSSPTGDGVNWFASTSTPSTSATSVMLSHAISLSTSATVTNGISMDDNASITIGAASVAVPATTFTGTAAAINTSTFTGTTISGMSAANSKVAILKGSYTTSNASICANFAASGTLSPGSTLEINGTGSGENKFGMTSASTTYLANASLNLKGNAFLFVNSNQAAATTINIGSLAGESGSKLGWGTSSDLTRTITWSVGANNSSTEFAGALTNIGGYKSGGAMYYGNYTNLIKVGTGSMTLSGNTTGYNGNITVNGGELIITGTIIGNNQSTTALSNTVSVSGSGTKLTVNGSLTATTISIASTGTLQGTGTITGATTIDGTLKGSATMNSATTISSTGTLSGSHTFASDLTLAGITNLTVTNFTGTNDLLNITGALTYGGTLNITVPETAPTVGTSIRLINPTNTPTGAFSTINLANGYTFDPSTGYLTYNGNSTSGSVSISTAGLPANNATITVNSGGTLTIDQAATVNKITVAPGAQVTLNSGINLTANTVELQSSSSGTATFVDADATGKTVTGTIQQYLPTGRNWYVGIPIANGDNSTTASSLTAGGATSVSYWDEPTGAWVNDYAGSLTKGRGYIAVSGSGSATNNISFSGTFNTGSVPVTVTRTVGATKEGFNLIANPYPSYLNPCDLITGSSKMEPTIWYRTKGAAYSFETVNTASGEGTNGVTGYIPPMQAFWVRVKANATDAAQNNSETLIFSNAMRYHANPSGVTTTALKAPKSAQNMLLRLQVSNGVNADEAIIYANTNASNTYDAYDSHKMSNNSALIPEIYTTVGAEQLVINGLNEIPLNTEIPVGFSNLQSGTNSFKLRASELRNISSDTKVFLLDKSTNAETELTTASDYTFTSEATNTTSRFSVIFKSVGQTTGTVDKSDKKAIVYTNNGQIVFVANEVPTGDNNSLMIFDATGRKVADLNITSTVTGINNINIPGVYLVRAIVNGQPYSAKINLNH